jgi:hypothetical protein
MQGAIFNEPPTAQLEIKGFIFTWKMIAREDDCKWRWLHEEYPLIVMPKTRQNWAEGLAARVKYN